MKNSAHVVVQVARQIEGEYIFVKPVGLFDQIERAKSFVKSLGVSTVQTIQGVECNVEVAIFEDVLFVD